MRRPYIHSRKTLLYAIIKQLVCVCTLLIMTLNISFLRYIWGGLLVLFGIFLNVYSKNRDKMKLPSIKDLRSWLLMGKKVRFLSQNVWEATTGKAEVQHKGTAHLYWCSLGPRDILKRVPTVQASLLIWARDGYTGFDCLTDRWHD